MNKINHKVNRQGDQAWFLDGSLHRDDGPALIWANGRIEWHLFGVRYLYKKDYLKALAKHKGQEWADMVRLIHA